MSGDPAFGSSRSTIWGQGFVELVEIPTDREINDNIVAYWRPEGEISAANPLRFSYRMRWTEDVMPPAEILWVSSSRSGVTLDQNWRVFAVEYSPRSGSRPPDLSGLDLSISASDGEVRNGLIHPPQADGTLLVTFEFSPRNADLCELRLALSRQGKQAGETWLFRWTTP